MAEPYPLGRNPKLDELMVLVAVSAAAESGNGYDLDVLRREAARATKLWNEHQAHDVRAFLEMNRCSPDRMRTDDPYLAELGRRLQEACDIIERLSTLPVHRGDMVVTDAMIEAGVEAYEATEEHVPDTADIVEAIIRAALTAPQGVSAKDRETGR